MPFGPEHKSSFGESLDRMARDDFLDSVMERAQAKGGRWTTTDVMAYLAEAYQAGQASLKAFREGYEAGVRDAKNGTVEGLQ